MGVRNWQKILFKEKHNRDFVYGKDCLMCANAEVTVHKIRKNHHCCSKQCKSELMKLSILRGNERKTEKIFREASKDKPQLSSGSYTNHRSVFKSKVNKIPSGWVIHHINGQRDDNAESNLICIPSFLHKLLHEEMYMKGGNFYDRKQTEEALCRLLLNPPKDENRGLWPHNINYLNKLIASGW